MAKVIRYCVNKETHVGENNFLIHRPFIFSNPFTHIKDKKTSASLVVNNKDEAIEMYEEYFERMLETSQKFKEEWNRLFEAYNTFDEIYIGCYCNESDSCHADIIISKLKKRSIKEMLKNVSQKGHGV